MRRSSSSSGSQQFGCNRVPWSAAVVRINCAEELKFRSSRCHPHENFKGKVKIYRTAICVRRRPQHTSTVLISGIFDPTVFKSRLKTALFTLHCLLGRNVTSLSASVPTQRRHYGALEIPIVLYCIVLSEVMDQECQYLIWVLYCALEKCVLVGCLWFVSIYDIVINL